MSRNPAISHTGLSLAYLQEAAQNVRVHGNGFVQIDLADRPGCRVHMFGHPAIPRQVKPTPVHDHRFGFHSTVLSGTLVNVIWNARTHANPLEATHEVCHYSPGIGEDTKLHRTGQFVSLMRECVKVLQPGGAYEIVPEELHETFANEPTITYIQKTRSDPITPRVLVLRGREPDNSFDRNTALDPGDAWGLFVEAWREAGLPLRSGDA